MMKICCRCKIEKDFFDFNKDKQCRDGLRPFCRDCSKKEWSARYQANKVKERVRKSQYYQKNKTIILGRTSTWLKSNRAYGAMKVATRRALQNKSTPHWLTEIHLQQIQWYYSVAQMFTAQTGDVNHVDHIHPIRGKNFCGLHVPWNLRVIKGSDNAVKGNSPPADEAYLFWV
jgi:5-methylcytosine-specific restriction endonuclease McrA